MAKRDTSGHFVKGGCRPQTVAGWINRLIDYGFGSYGIGQRKLIDKIGLEPLRNRKYKKKIQKNPIKHTIVKKQKIASYNRHREYYINKFRQNYRSNKETYSNYNASYYKKNRQWLLPDQHDYYWKRGGREKSRIYTKKNPRSRCSDSIEIELAMNQARKIHGNRCQWGGKDFELCQKILAKFGVEDFASCNKTANDVAHIYSRGYGWYYINGVLCKQKFPELAAEPFNLIPLCFEHHICWHEIKGDTAAVALIKIRANKSGLDYDFKTYDGFCYGY